MNKEKLEKINDNIELRMITEQSMGYIEKYSPELEDTIDLYNEVIILQHQLKEKDKIIDEILNTSFFTNDCPYSLIGDGFIQELCDCDNCQDDYKKCWLKYFESEVEGGKK